MQLGTPGQARAGRQKTTLADPRPALCCCQALWRPAAQLSERDRVHLSSALSGPSYQRGQPKVRRPARKQPGMKGQGPLSHIRNVHREVARWMLEASNQYGRKMRPQRPNDGGGQILKEGRGEGGEEGSLHRSPAEDRRVPPLVPVAHPDGSDTGASAGATARWPTLSRAGG